MRNKSHIRSGLTALFAMMATLAGGAHAQDNNNAFGNAWLAGSRILHNCNGNAIRLRFGRESGQLLYLERRPSLFLIGLA